MEASVKLSFSIFAIVSAVDLPYLIIGFSFSNSITRSISTWTVLPQKGQYFNVELPVAPCEIFWIYNPSNPFFLSFHIRPKNQLPFNNSLNISAQQYSIFISFPPVPAYHPLTCCESPYRPAYSHKCLPIPAVL